MGGRKAVVEADDGDVGGEGELVETRRFRRNTRKGKGAAREVENGGSVEGGRRWVEYALARCQSPLAGRYSEWNALKRYRAARSDANLSLV